MRWFIWIVALFPLQFFAESTADSFNFKASKAEIIDKRENYFLINTDYRISPKVNPITGECVEDEEDLVVAGSQPLSLRRFYNHFGPYDSRYASWRYNPECFFYANFEWEGQEIFAAIGERNGSICSFKRSKEDSSLFKFDVPKGFSADTSTGKEHPLNSKIKFRKKGDPKDKKSFEYYGDIFDGSGRARTFKSHMHRWTDYVHYKEKRGFPTFSEKEYEIRANTWTPYHIAIQDEKLPNGNIIHYEFTQWKKGKNYFRPEILESIIAYNASRTKILGKLNFEYPNKDDHNEVSVIEVTGSDNRRVFLHQVDSKGKGPVVLSEARAAGLPTIKYNYRERNLVKIEKPEGRILTTEYDPKTNKVTTQYAPVGLNGEMCPIARYVYHQRSTEVFDAEGNKTIYHFDDNKQILALETYNKGNLYRIDRFNWDPSSGNLLRKTVEDGSGRSILITEYKYDKNQNPIEEKVGDGREWRTIYRTFSDDGFNLKLTEYDQANRVIRYKYIPQTNLLAAELIYEGPVIRKRTFHEYDDCAICIKTIVDDGCTEEPYNLHGVTYRKITEIKPKQNLPCFGLPEIVQEKTIGTSGNETLLNKVIYSYTNFGQILKEDHYDANNNYRFSLTNEYDDKERLSAKIDALGHKTCFTYDANNNLISISGPKSGQHKEITYDRANRPIKIADRQSDGTILITEKKYDKLGRVIEETDSCQNKTRFRYDSLSRLNLIIHPDGAVERKEYDILDNLIYEMDPQGNETRKVYNPFKQVTAIYYPDGTTEQLSYHPTGTLSSHTDKNGSTSVYTYDIFDHVIKKAVYSSLGNLLKALSVIWTAFQKLSETDGDLTTTYTYDFAGRKIHEKKGYREIHYVHDPLGRVRITKQGDTDLVEEYDTANQLTERRNEKAGSIQFQEKYVYDNGGNLSQIINSQGITESSFNTRDKPLSVKDALGFITQFSYTYNKTLTETTINPKGVQTISIKDVHGREAKFLKKNAQNTIVQEQAKSYDKNGNLISLTHTVFSGTNPAKALKHSWEYGPMNRLERFLEAGERETRYLYDNKSRLKTIIKPNGAELSYEYDDLGRTTRFYGSDFNYQYTYDLNDRLISVYDGFSQTTTSRSYDTLGNVLKEKLSTDLSFTNTYDTIGRKIALTLPDSSSIDYTYDGIYLYQVKRGNYLHSYSARNLEGEIIQVQLPNSEKVFIERDKLGRCATFDSAHYNEFFPHGAYDGVGNLLRYQCKDPRGQTEYAFSYDDLDQLISESDHTYQFDSLYNRLKKDDSNYTVNSLCQVTNDGKSNYVFDPCGNLISDGDCKYSYDSLDRLIAVETGNKRITFSYDSFHRRLSKTVFVNGNKNSYIRYLWDGDNEIGSIDESNRIQELRVLGEGLEAEIGSAILYELNGKSYIPIHDHRGCVVVLIDLKTNKPIETYRYNAFGEELTNNTLSPWRFSSKRVDTETNLVFFGRRYYHPSLGRWITQDPEGFDGGPNLYAYLNNCPLVDCDPYGLFSPNESFTSNALYLCGMPGAIANFFGVGKPKYYTHFESQFSNKSMNYDLGFRELPLGEIGRTNGIFNNRADMKQAALELSQMAGGYNVHGTYNACNGIYDLHEVTMNLYRKIHTDPVLDIQNRWSKFFDKSPPDVPYFEECHSGGTALVKLALETFPKVLRERIIVAAYAPSAYIPKELCRKVRHYVSDSDFVPFFDFKGRKQCADTIVVLKRHPNAPFPDHTISSPTYAPARRYQVGNYLESLPGYQR